MFKKIALLLIALMGLAFMAQSALVLEDHFDYVSGDLNGQGSWTKAGTRDLNVTPGSLTYGDLKTSGGKITIEQGNLVTSAYAKDFPNLTLTEGQSVYFSFLVHIRTTGDDTSFTFDIESNMGRDPQIQTGLIGFYGMWDYTYQKSPTLSLSAGTHLLIGKVTKVGGHGTLEVWADPSNASLGGSTESGTLVSTTRWSGLTDFTMESLLLRNNVWSGDRVADLDLDEIRIGDTWADVTPVETTSVPVPVPSGNLVLNEDFDYSTGELAGQGGWSKTGTRRLQVTEGTLVYDNLTTSGNKITIEQGNLVTSAYTQNFPDIVLPNMGDSMYFSFLLNVRNTGAGENSFSLQLNNNKKITLIQTLDDSSAGIKGWFNQWVDIQETAPFALSDGTHLIVGKFTNGNLAQTLPYYSSVQLWIDPSDLNSSTENGTYGEMEHSIVEGAISVQSISLSHHVWAGSDIPDMDIDEVRVGSTWADVTPTSTSTTPSNPTQANVAMNSYFCGTSYLSTVHRNFFKKVRSYENDMNCTRLLVGPTTASSTGNGSITVTINGKNYVTAISPGERAYVIAGKVALTLHNAGLNILGVNAVSFESKGHYAILIHLPTETVSLSDSLAGITTVIDASLQKNFHVDDTGNLIDNAGSINFYPYWPNGVYDLTWTGSGSVRLNTYQDGIDAEYPTANSATFTLNRSLDKGEFTDLPYTLAGLSVSGTPHNIQAIKRDDPYTGNIRNIAINHALAYGSNGFRFLGMGLTINHDMRGWSKRPLTNSPSYSISCPTLSASGADEYITSGGSGIPWEDQVEFANACYALNAKFKPWFCVPFDTPPEESALIRDLLDDFNGPAYNIEYGNELWNPHFSEGQLILKRAAESGRSPQEEALLEAATTLAPFTSSSKAIPLFAWGTGQWNHTLETLIANNYAGIKDVIQMISAQPYVVTDTTKSTDYLFEKSNPQPGSYWDPNPLTNPIDKAATFLQSNLDIATRLGLSFDAYEGFNLHNTGNAQRGLEISMDPRYEEIQREIMETLMPIMPEDSYAYVMTSIGGGEWGILKYELQPPSESPAARAMMGYDAEH